MHPDATEWRACLAATSCHQGPDPRICAWFKLNFEHAPLLPCSFSSFLPAEGVSAGGRTSFAAWVRFLRVTAITVIERSRECAEMKRPRLFK